MQLFIHRTPSFVGQNLEWLYISGHFITSRYATMTIVYFNKYFQILFPPPGSCIYQTIGLCLPAISSVAFFLPIADVGNNTPI